MRGLWHTVGMDATRRQCCTNTFVMHLRISRMLRSIHTVSSLDLLACMHCRGKESEGCDSGDQCHTFICRR